MDVEYPKERVRKGVWGWGVGVGGGRVSGKFPGNSWNCPGNFREFSWKSRQGWGGSLGTKHDIVTRQLKIFGHGLHELLFQHMKSIVK